jgi:hypothetical protein
MGGENVWCHTCNRLAWVWSQRGEGAKIKTTKISSEGLTCNSVKFCTSENFPLYDNTAVSHTCMQYNSELPCQQFITCITGSQEAYLPVSYQWWAIRLRMRLWLVVYSCANALRIIKFLLAVSNKLLMSTVIGDNILEKWLQDFISIAWESLHSIVTWQYPAQEGCPRPIIG